MTHTFDTPVRIAQAVGITTAAFIAGIDLHSSDLEQREIDFLLGIQAAESFLLVPSLLQSPAPLLAQQWKTLWKRAGAIMPIAVISCSAVFGWLTSRGSFNRVFPLTNPVELT